MNISLKSIKRDKSYIDDIKRLYLSAFPKEERAPFRTLLRRAKRKNINFFACVDNNEFVGLLYVVNHLDMSYIFYFAVKEDKRGRGYGTAILKAALKKYKGRRFFLAIEEVTQNYENYPQRLKRLRFYQNAGFARSGQKMQEAYVIFDLLGVGGAVDNKGYRALMKRFLGLRALLLPFKIFDNEEQSDDQTK